MLRSGSVVVSLELERRLLAGVGEDKGVPFGRECLNSKNLIFLTNKESWGSVNFKSAPI